MLPTTGFFKDIECPFFDDCCDRPYCHFRHRKKNVEPAKEDEKETAEVPTYNPTPKSQLANTRSHIPIKYVPDLERSSLRKLQVDKFPTYNPTPLSLLGNVTRVSTANNEGANGENGEKSRYDNITINYPTTEYNPNEPLKTDDINFEELSNEFDMIDEIISEENPKATDNTTEDNNEKVADVVKKERSSKDRHKKHYKKESRNKKDEKGKSDKSKHEERRKSDDKHKKHSSSSSRHKDKDKSSHKDKKKNHTSKHSSQHKDHKEKSPNKKEKSNSPPQKEKSPEPADDKVSDVEMDLDTTDVNFDSEDETLQECYRIFNEYKPEEPQIQRDLVIDKKEETTISTETNCGKKRVAHEKAEKNPPKITAPTHKRPLDAAVVMNNRFKLARLVMANNEQKHIAEALKKPASSISKINPQNEIKPKRIAPAQNVNLMQRAKAKIEELARQKAAIAMQKTVAQTVNKGAKRVAHVPEFSLSDIPDVLNADKSKLPVNVRTRYLTMIADECVKLYVVKDDAYQRALNEEFKCYEKCKVLATYRNSAMLSVNRLRKEVQEREKAGLGPIMAGEESSDSKPSELKGRKFYDNIKHFVLSEEELQLHGYPRESDVPGKAVIHNQKIQPVQRLRDNERKCVRCSKLYVVDGEGFPLRPEDCVYHPLKKRTFRGESIYLCCRGSDETGCATSNTHVCETPQTSDLEGFQTTLEPFKDDDSRSYAVYALDCEMCYTTKGLELTRVTIVDTDLKTVYESLVKPLNPIIDYNTRFSGITKEQMDRTSTSILQVQANILHLCNSKTILIGHSLESDMKALKIVHSNVVDTSVLFPHKLGLPHKRALKALASEYLKKIIQNDVSGHDSAEDALACMELIIWKVKEDLKVKGIKV